MPLNKNESILVRDAIKCLKGNQIADDLKPHLEELRLYLDTWVIPQLEVLIEEPSVQRTCDIRKMASYR